MTPDFGARNSRLHKRIVKLSPHPLVPRMFLAELACGHECIIIGNPAIAEGVVLCDQCIEHERENAENN